MKSNRKLWLTSLVVAAAIITAGYTTTIMISSNAMGKERTLDVPLSVQNAAASEAEDIPLYPGAEQVKRDDRGLPSIRNAVYNTLATPEEVVKFYQQSLLSEKGWSIRSNNESKWDKRIHFLWKDPKNVTPWRINLHIIAGGPINETAAGRTTVQVLMDRWPDPKRIPLYPDAQQVEANEVIDKDGDPTDHTTYITDAAPDKVKTYYKTTLPQYGWLLRDENSSSLVPKGMHFSYQFGGAEGMFVGGVGVLAVVDPNGRTQVTISSLEVGIP